MEDAKTDSVNLAVNLGEGAVASQSNGGVTDEQIDEALAPHLYYCDDLSLDEQRCRNSRVLDKLDAVMVIRALLAELGSERAFDRSHIQQLQKALMFWLPMVPDSPDDVCKRTGDDAMLLMGYEGEDEPSAEALGWIALQSGISSNEPPAK